MNGVASQTSSHIHAWRALVAGLSLLLWVGLAASYALRPDGAAAVTLFPPWLWVAPALLLAFLSGWRWRGSQVLGGMWVVFLLLFAEEPRSVLRPGSPTPARITHDGVVRVVSLNCAGGNPDAAAEVQIWNPDLVLLQEAPAERDVHELARRLYGSQGGVVYGSDTAVLARGPVLAAVPPRKSSYFVAARLGSLAVPVELISLHLTPPVVRMDLWSPGCWTEQTANRRARREQVEELRKHLDGIPPETPLVVGGGSKRRLAMPSSGC